MRLQVPGSAQPGRRRVVLCHQLHRRRSTWPTARRTTSSCTSTTGTNWAAPEQVQISDAGNGKVLDTETISSFSNGLYLDWKVAGNLLLITITNHEAAANAVLNGVVPRLVGAHLNRELPKAGRDHAGELERAPTGAPGL